MHVNIKAFEQWLQLISKTPPSCLLDLTDSHHKLKRKQSSLLFFLLQIGKGEQREKSSTHGESLTETPLAD